MARLRLTDADRERLGCAEFLPFDANTLTNREAILLKAWGYPTPLMWRKAVIPKEVKDDEGTVFVEVDYQAWTVLVCLALRRSGIETDPATLTFDTGFEYLGDPEPIPPVVEPGKAPVRARSKTSTRKSSTSTAT